MMPGYLRKVFEDAAVPALMLMMEYMSEKKIKDRCAAGECAMMPPICSLGLTIWITWDIWCNLGLIRANISVWDTRIKQYV